MVGSEDRTGVLSRFKKNGQMKDIEEIARTIVHSAIKVHKALGTGLLESVYQKCLACELEKVGLTVACEVPMPVRYD